MELPSLDAPTLVNALVIGGIFFAIRGSVRTRKLIEKGRTNIGLAMVLVGLAIISMHYLANVIAVHFLPHFMSVNDTWAILRNLRLNGYWSIIGSGLLCLVCGLHLVFRDMRTLALQLDQVATKSVTK